jgi:hypothetical protein
MWQIYRRHRIAWLVWYALAITGVGASLTACRKSDTTKPPGAGKPQADERERQLLRTTFMVEHSDEGAARAYYTETLNALGLGAKTDLDKNEPNMSVMLEFLGYAGLSPTELEDTPSVELMTRFGDDLLASAFFAPKITDVSQGDPDKINVGWRKVIRLSARPGSDASKRGIAAGFLLFNKFQGTNHNVDPFAAREDESNESQTTQLILVRAGKSSDDDPANRPLHFFVFGPASKGAKLKFALQASFDAASPEVEAELAKTSTVKNYFVPVACAQCHGGLAFNDEGVKVPVFARQKLNFLDTDHWFDRVQSGDDFAFLQATNFGVLFDGEKDESTPKFAAAFDVLRRLNTEIKEQNGRVDDSAKPSFQFRAVNKWLQLHASSDNGHKDVFARALDPLTGASPAWNRDAEPDKRLLVMMNQYCYRCHSSVIYSIFDRPEVACRKVKINNFLNLTPGDAKYMPQDRVLDPSVKATLLELISKLPDGVKCSK